MEISNSTMSLKKDIGDLTLPELNKETKQFLLQASKLSLIPVPQSLLDPTLLLSPSLKELLLTLIAVVLMHFPMSHSPSIQLITF